MDVDDLTAYKEAQRVADDLKALLAEEVFNDFKVAVKSSSQVSMRLVTIEGILLALGEEEVLEIPVGMVLKPDYPVSPPYCRLIIPEGSIVSSQSPVVNANAVVVAAAVPSLATWASTPEDTRSLIDVFLSIASECAIHTPFVSGASESVPTSDTAVPEQRRSEADAPHSEVVQEPENVPVEANVGTELEVEPVLESEPMLEPTLELAELAPEAELEPQPEFEQEDVIGSKSEAKLEHVLPNPVPEPVFESDSEAKIEHVLPNPVPEPVFELEQEPEPELSTAVTLEVPEAVEPAPFHTVLDPITGTEVTQSTADCPESVPPQDFDLATVTIEELEALGPTYDPAACDPKPDSTPSPPEPTYQSFEIDAFTGKRIPVAVEPTSVDDLAELEALTIPKHDVGPPDPAPHSTDVLELQVPSSDLAASTASIDPLASSAGPEAALLDPHPVLSNEMASHIPNSSVLSAFAEFDQDDTSALKLPAPVGQGHNISPLTLPPADPTEHHLRPATVVASISNDDMTALMASAAASQEVPDATRMNGIGAVHVSESPDVGSVAQPIVEPTSQPAQMKPTLVHYDPFGNRGAPSGGPPDAVCIEGSVSFSDVFPVNEADADHNDEEMKGKLIDMLAERMGRDLQVFKQSEEARMNSVVSRKEGWTMSMENIKQLTTVLEERKSSIVAALPDIEQALKDARNAERRAVEFLNAPGRVYLDLIESDIPLHQQWLEVDALDKALEDCMHGVEEALKQGAIDTNQFHKCCLEIGRRLFETRALQNKINARIQMMKGNQGGGGVARLAAPPLPKAPVAVSVPVPVAAIPDASVAGIVPQSSCSPEQQQQGLDTLLEEFPDADPIFVKDVFTNTV